MRVVVYGGRDFTNEAVVKLLLDQLHEEYGFTLVIDGAAKGADSLAHAWAISRNIATLRFPAEWNKYGRGAGPIRNRQMIVEGKPDVAVAFPGGAGTSNMTKQLAEFGIETRFVIKK
jgi:hypothetical protein